MSIGDAYGITMLRYGRLWNSVPNMCMQQRSNVLCVVYKSPSHDDTSQEIYSVIRYGEHKVLCHRENKALESLNNRLGDDQSVPNWKGVEFC